MPAGLSIGDFPLPWAVVFLPWLGALLLGFLPRESQAALANIGVSAASFLVLGSLTCFCLVRGTLRGE